MKGENKRINSFIKKVMFRSLMKNTEVRKKVMLTIGIMLLITIVSNLPILSINRSYLSNWMKTSIFNSFYLFQLMGGNSFSSMSIFALGVSPYITASIVLQLLEVIFVKLKELKQDGKTGQDKYEKIMYILAFILCITESIAMTAYFKKTGLLYSGIGFLILTAVSMIIGSVILVVLGKVIEKKGIGNGISLILMFNILSGFPTDVRNIYYTHIYKKSAMHITFTLIITVLIIVTMFLTIIYMQNTEKRIKVTYSGKVIGNKMGQTQKNYIPLKLNMAGVIPVIFAATIFQVLALIFNIFSKNKVCEFLNHMFSTRSWFSMKHPTYTLGVIIYILLIIFFSYFYNNIQFNVKEVSDNLKKNGGMINGIRPGIETEKYLKKKMKYLVLIGAIVISCIVLVPIIITGIFGLSSLSFGSTSLIIVVGVILETAKALSTELASTRIPSRLFTSSKNNGTKKRLFA